MIKSIIIPVYLLFHSSKHRKLHMWPLLYLSATKTPFSDLHSLTTLSLYILFLNHPAHIIDLWFWIWIHLWRFVFQLLPKPDMIFKCCMYEHLASEISVNMCGIISGYINEGGLLNLARFQKFLKELSKVRKYLLTLWHPISIFPVMNVLCWYW